MTFDPYVFAEDDWFSPNISVWQHVFADADRPSTALEIGAFEGRSTVWIGENLLASGGELVVVDHWNGGEEHESVDMTAVQARFEANITTLLDRHPEIEVRILREPSVRALARLLSEDRAGSFDFIYVDASHEAPDVLSDATLAYALLRVGGLLAFDDYAWREFEDANHNPKVAIDAFANVFWNRLTLVNIGYQAFFRKVA